MQGSYNYTGVLLATNRPHCVWDSVCVYFIFLFIHNDMYTRLETGEQVQKY